MSEDPVTAERVELTRRQFGFAEAGDWDGVMTFFGADTEWDMTPAGLGTHDGPAALRQFFVSWTASYEEWEIELEEVHDLGVGMTLAIAMTRGPRSRRAAGRGTPTGAAAVGLEHRGSVPPGAPAAAARPAPGRG